MKGYLPSFDHFCPLSISLMCFPRFPLYKFISAYSFSNISRSQWPISSRTTCNRFILIVQLSLRYSSIRRTYEFVGWLKMETQRKLPSEGKTPLYTSNNHSGLFLWICKSGRFGRKLFPTKTAKRVKSSITLSRL